jgi:hypothetical protein
MLFFWNCVAFACSSQSFHRGGAVQFLINSCDLMSLNKHQLYPIPAMSPNKYKKLDARTLPPLQTLQFPNKILICHIFTDTLSQNLLTYLLHGAESFLRS